MPKKILFVYRDGRKERIDDLNRGREAPTDFLYGFTYFDRQRFIPHFVEVTQLAPKKFNPKYWKLLRSDKKFALDYGIGKSRHWFLGHIDFLNQFDVIIGTNDSLSLGLTYYKKIGQLQSKVVFLAMGSGRVLSYLKNLGSDRFRRYKDEVNESIKRSSAVVLLGEGEYKFLREEYIQFAKKIRLIPFGIDTAFWTPDLCEDTIQQIPYCLFVGNDTNRDYELLLDVARCCSNERFVFVSSKISPDQCPKNVELLVGNFSEAQVSDRRLRELYRRARLVLLPLKDSIQPSGQSVALQAMACGTPLLMTRTSGLWDNKVMKDMKNCLLVEPGHTGAIVSVIKNLPNLYPELNEIGKNGLFTVKRHFSATKFSEQLQSLVEEILHPGVL